MRQQNNSDLLDSYKMTYKVSEKDTSALVHKEVKKGGGKLEDKKDPFVFYFIFFASITTPQVKQNGDRSAGDNYCIPSAKYRV